VKLAVLDDYQQVAARMADWSVLEGHCEVTFFHRHIALADAGDALADFDALLLMRERLPMPRELIGRLPRLRLIIVTGTQNRALDLAAAAERGIVVCHTRVAADAAHSTPELAWGLILAVVRHIPQEDRRLRDGLWQQTIGTTLYGKTLGLLGLGRIGRRMAEYGRAFGMNVIAWSQNLMAEAAAASAAVRVEKRDLFTRSDVLSIHLVLSERTRGLVGGAELALMRSSAVLINTSRGPIVDEAALIAALRERRIAGAGLDVFDTEPLPAEHPIRALSNVVITPHIGYVVEEAYRTFYGDAIEAVLAYQAGTPVRVLNPAVLAR
jgi:phosphoglycerate dehydrogenase-like enzyme